MLGKTLLTIFLVILFIVTTELSREDGQGFWFLIPIGFGLLVITMLPIRFFIKRFRQ